MDQEYFCVVRPNVSMQVALQIIKHYMIEVAAENQHVACEPVSRRSAPNTSTFTATISGMIEYQQGVNIHGGYYGIPQFFPVFLKIGGRINEQTRSNLFEQLGNMLNEHLLDENSQPFKIHTNIYCTDGTIWFSTTDGTNWGGIGVNGTTKYTHTKDQYEIMRSRLCNC